MEIFSANSSSSQSFGERSSSRPTFPGQLSHMAAGDGWPRHALKCKVQLEHRRPNGLARAAGHTAGEGARAGGEAKKVNFFSWTRTSFSLILQSVFFQAIFYDPYLLLIFFSLLLLIVTFRALGACIESTCLLSTSLGSQCAPGSSESYNSNSLFLGPFYESSLLFPAIAFYQTSGFLSHNRSLLVSLFEIDCLERILESRNSDLQIFDCSPFLCLLSQAFESLRTLSAWLYRRNRSQGLFLRCSYALRTLFYDTYAVSFFWRCVERCIQRNIFQFHRELRKLSIASYNFYSLV